MQAILAAPPAAPPDFEAGKTLFTKTCGACHTLFKEGGGVGPDLTGYDRQNIDFWLLNTIDPNAAIREEFVTFRIKTRSGQSFVGLVTERGANHVTLVDSSRQKTVIPVSDITDERALRTSIMPEELLSDLSERQLRDLFAYLMKRPDDAR